MLITGSTELATVQLVLDFLGMCWWELLLSHVILNVWSILSLLFYCNVKCGQGLKIQHHRQGWILEFRGLRQTLRKIPQTACWGAPLAHWQTIVALFWKTYDLLQILLKCCLTVVHKFFNRTMQKPVFSLRLFGRLFCNSIVAIRKLERHVRKALHCGSK